MIPAVLSNKLRELRFRLVLRHYRKLAITKVALLEKGLPEQATWKKGSWQKRNFATVLGQNVYCMPPEDSVLSL